MCQTPRRRTVEVSEHTHTHGAQMTTTTDNPIRNGVDRTALFATIDAVKGGPELANFQFRVTNRWVNGTHNQSTIHGFYRR